MHPTPLKPKTTASQTSKMDPRLPAVWGHELLHVAMMSAQVTLGCNKLALRESAAGMAVLDPNIPDEPAVHRAIEQDLLALPADMLALQETTQRAYEALSMAIANFRQLQSVPLASVVAEDVQGLAARWREASELLLVAVEHFDAKGLLRSNQSTPYALDRRCPLHIRHLLLDAIAGKVSEGGTVSVTGSTHRHGHFRGRSSLQRRRWDRRSLQIPIRANVKGKSFQATLRNISIGGALIDGIPFMMRGTPMQLTLDNGRTLDAAIMWARDNTVGVKFMQQLMLDDPLLEDGGDIDESQSSVA